MTVDGVLVFAPNAWFFGVDHVIIQMEETNLPPVLQPAIVQVKRRFIRYYLSDK